MFIGNFQVAVAGKPEDNYRQTEAHVTCAPHQAKRSHDAPLELDHHHKQGDSREDQRFTWIGTHQRLHSCHTFAGQMSVRCCQSVFLPCCPAVCILGPWDTESSNMNGLCSA